MLIHEILMFCLGLIAATLGSLAGLGGAFIAIPVLRIAFGFSPAMTAGTSLAMVTANVTSATIAFLRQGRVDVRLALLVGTCAIPGSLLGVWLSRFANPKWFDIAYAVFLLGVGVDMLLRGHRERTGATPRLPWQRDRVLFDRVNQKDVHYADSPPLEVIMGIFTGFISSFFGIGGGAVTVPILLRLFAMPAHIASATSHTIILISAPFGVAAQIAAHNVAWPDILPLAGGAILGGQIGATFSKRLAGAAFIRAISILLICASLSLIWQQLR
jgi:uncharacterized membrane protein YfcA